MALIISACLLSPDLSKPALSADNGRGSGAFVTDGAPVKRIVVTVNKSRTLNVERPFARAIVGASDYADVLPLSDRSIYVQGKQVGATNISLFDADAKLIGVLDLEVVLDTGALRERIRSSTGSRGITVSSIRGQIVLGGTAGDAVAADRAMALAKSLSPNQEVVNAMNVAPSQQVMLEVRFLEVTRDAGRRLGVNWFGANAAGTHGAHIGRGIVGTDGTTPSGIPIFATAGTMAGGGIGTPFGTFIARMLTTDNARIDLVVSALEEKGLLRRLAEPNLIALSGDTARFHAGGEFPVPIAANNQGGFPTVTIQFKEFGVKLNFTPTVLSRGVINLRIAPEVSELDFSNVVQVQGTTIPALVKRDAVTTVELRDGQSFAIAGLLQAQNTRNMAQLPWIGSVPVLGALFRSAAYQQRETDLVIIVTPRLVAPAVPGQPLASPLDSRLPSNDVDFFLNGQPEVRKRYTDYVASGGGIKGPYGHLIQVEQGIPPARKSK